MYVTVNGFACGRNSLASTFSPGSNGLVSMELGQEDSLHGLTM